MIRLFLLLLKFFWMLKYGLLLPPRPQSVSRRRLPAGVR